MDKTESKPWAEVAVCLFGLVGALSGAFILVCTALDAAHDLGILWRYLLPPKPAKSTWGQEDPPFDLPDAGETGDHYKARGGRFIRTDGSVYHYSPDGALVEDLPRPDLALLQGGPNGEGS